MKIKTFVGRPGTELDNKVNQALSQSSGGYGRPQEYVHEIKMSGVSRDGMVAIMVIWGDIPVT